MKIEGNEESEQKRIIKETIKANNCQICSILQETFKIFTVEIEKKRSLDDYVKKTAKIKH